jgi:hypothetical protein
MALALYRLCLTGQPPFSLTVFSSHKKWKAHINIDIEAKVYDIGVDQQSTYTIYRLPYRGQEEHQEGAFTYEHMTKEEDLYYALLRHFSVVDNAGWHMASIANKVEFMLKSLQTLTFPATMQREIFQFIIFSQIIESRSVRSERVRSVK